MRRVSAMLGLWLALLTAGAAWAKDSSANNASELLALCYHNVVHTEEQAKQDPSAVTVDMLVSHLSWLQGTGHTPISLAQWHSGEALPEKPVLLTFDDGYTSFRSMVLPLLELYGFPAVLAAVTSWVETPATELVNYGGELRPREDFLDWQDLKEIKASGLIEIVSHSHDLHRGIVANAYGNVQPSANAFAYHGHLDSYETDTEYHARVSADLSRSRELLAEKINVHERVIAWPYGAHHDAAIKAATSAGFTDYLTLSNRPNVRGAPGIHRALVSNNTDLAELKRLTQGDTRPGPVRAVHVDLDYVYDEAPGQFAKNLDLLLDRIKAMQVSTVFLQAFADPDGNGVADALYFPNRHLPVRMDIFNRVAWQLRTRAGVAVYAWMPVLAFELPDTLQNQRLAVLSDDGSHRERYHRLSPFHAGARKLISEIYEDLGRSVAFDGVLFHDDAFLTDREDVSPAAVRYAQSQGLGKLSAAQKTAYLIDFTDQLTHTLRRWQPDLKTARNLYAETVLNPESETWFAQNFEAFLDHYDYTALMAMPYLEQARHPHRWLARLMKTVALKDPGFERTVFHMQTYDWWRNKPISSRVLARKFKQLLRGGVRHIAYYPDDFFNDHPSLEMVRERLSVNDFPALLGAGDKP